MNQSITKEWRQRVYNKQSKHWIYNDHWISIEPNAIKCWVLTLEKLNEHSINQRKDQERDRTHLHSSQVTLIDFVLVLLPRYDQLGWEKHLWIKEYKKQNSKLILIEHTQMNCQVVLYVEDLEYLNTINNQLKYSLIEEYEGDKNYLLSYYLWMLSSKDLYSIMLTHSIITSH